MSDHTTVLVEFDVDTPTHAEAERLLGMWLPAARTTWRKPGTEALSAWNVVTDREAPYDQLLAAERALGALGVSTSQVDLANVIRSVVDEALEDEPEETVEAVVRQAYEVFVAGGGVEYETDVGELLYHTVRDRVSDALRDGGFIPGYDQ